MRWAVILRAGTVTALTIAAWLGLVAAQGGQILGRVPKGEACVVVYVYDGDTVALDCGGARDVTARLVGLDAPETTRPRCDAEAAHGQRATARLRALVAGGDLRLERVGVDKYRRPLMRLFARGQDVAELLVRENLAVPYRGGARPDWCARLGA